MAGPLVALLARATAAMRGVAAGNAARAGAGQAAQQAAAAAQAQQAREAMRQGVRMAQEAAYSRQQARQSGTDGSLATTFNQAKGAMAYGMRTGDSAAIEVGISKFLELAKRVSPIPGLFVALAVAVALLPKKLAQFGSALLESRRNLAEMNGGYAVSYARLDAQRFGRSVRLAGMTSGSTAQLAAATSRLEDKLLPFAAAGINLLNKIVAGMENATTFGITLLEAAAKIDVRLTLIKIAIDKLNKETGATTNHLTELTNRVADGMLSGRRWKK